MTLPEDVAVTMLVAGAGGVGLGLGITLGAVLARAVRRFVDRE